MPRISVLSEDNNRLVLDTIRQLIASGYVVPGSEKTPPVTEQGGYLFYNASGEIIPAFAIMQIVETTLYHGRPLYKVKKYNESDGVGFLFNGPRDVADKQLGTAQTGPHYRALGDGSTLTEGHLWGPVGGEWSLTDNGGMYVAMGGDQLVNDVLRVRVDETPAYDAIVTTAIGAYSSGYGSGVVSLQYAGASGSLQTLQAGVTVYNRFLSGMAIDDIVTVARMKNGKLRVIAQECG